MKNILARLHSKLKKNLYFCLFKKLNTGFSIEEALIISGETRSGSTWLMEILQKIPGTVTQWEPLHPDKGTVAKMNKNYGDRPFVSGSDKDEPLKELLEMTMKGEVCTKWTTEHNLSKQLLRPERMLTKFVRANMLMPWLLKNFNFKRKPIILIRHPIAACLSQLRTFHRNKEKKIYYNVPDCVNNERFIENQEYIDSLQTRLERSIAVWCINNIPTLHSSFVQENTIFVFYEDFLSNPVQEINRILEAWELDDEENKKITLCDLHKKSKTATMDFEKNIAVQLSKWREKLNSDTLRDIQKVFDHFDFSLYNTHDLYPVQKAKLDNDIFK